VSTCNGANLFGARLFNCANVYLKFTTLHTKLVPVDVMKVCGNGGTASPVLIVGTRWRWWSALRLGRSTPTKELRYPLNRRLFGPYSRSGRFGAEKISYFRRNSTRIVQIWNKINSMHCVLSGRLLSRRVCSASSNVNCHIFTQKQIRTCGNEMSGFELQWHITFSDKYVPLCLQLTWCICGMEHNIACCFVWVWIMVSGINGRTWLDDVCE